MSIMGHRPASGPKQAHKGADMEAELNKCLSFIHCQLQPENKQKSVTKDKLRWRAVTISRQTGAGGHAVAEQLAELLQKLAPNRCPWTVFDRELVEKVLEEHELPMWLAKYMPEDRIALIEDTVEELFGLHPPAWTLVQKTAETILHLSEMGNVILIGRGANVVTSRLDYVFHVRLVAPVEKRVEQIMEARQAGEKAAREFIREEDLGRQRYVKKYFGKQVEDPLQYHLVINTGLTGFKEAAKIIADAMLRGD